MDEPHASPPTATHEARFQGGEETVISHRDPIMTPGPRLHIRKKACYN